jgi:hypothetical protein
MSLTDPLILSEYAYVILSPCLMDIGPLRHSTGQGAIQMAQILNDRGQDFGMLFFDGEGHLDEAQRGLVIVLAVLGNLPIGVDGKAFGDEISR